MESKTWGAIVRCMYFVVAVCASLTFIAAAGIVNSVAAATNLADGIWANGIWTVQGRAIPGTRRCNDWMVRLTSRQGQLTGVVSLARAAVPIENLILLPDGSFSGTTRAGLVGSSHARAYKISGRFSGDVVHLTLENDVCPARSGTAVRQPVSR